MSTDSSKPRVAFLGLGLMGGGMARRLLNAGYPLAVYNRDPAKSSALASAGARVASSPREAAEHADVIVSMVADDVAARSCWLGEDGALAGAPRGSALIESSTASVGWIHELGRAAAARGCELLDAPVTGSRTHAAAGELNFLVGGNEATLARVRPVLAAMGKSVVYLGPLGSAALLKLINNFVCGVQVASMAEAMAMIERGGLERTRSIEVLTNGAPGSPLVKAIADRMVKADYTPNFMVRLMAKDLSYAVQEANTRSLELATATSALRVFQAGIAAGHGEKDIAAIVEQFRSQQ